MAALVLVCRSYDQEVIQIVNDESIPCCLTIHSAASARAVNILGAKSKPNGRAMLTNSESSYIIPISHLSSE